MMPSKLCTFEMDLLSICKIYKNTNKSFTSTLFFVYVVLFYLCVEFDNVYTLLIPTKQ